MYQHESWNQYKLPDRQNSLFHFFFFFFPPIATFRSIPSTAGLTLYSRMRLLWAIWGGGSQDTLMVELLLS